MLLSALMVVAPLAGNGGGVIEICFAVALDSASHDRRFLHAFPVWLAFSILGSGVVVVARAGQGRISGA